MPRGHDIADFAEPRDLFMVRVTAILAAWRSEVTAATLLPQAYSPPR